MDLHEAKQRLNIFDLWERFDLPGSPKTSCKSPFRQDARASFSVSADGLLFNDFATGEAGHAVDFLQLATGLSRGAARLKFIEMAGGGTGGAMLTPRRPARAPQARQRPTLPRMERGTPAELQTLATLRSVSLTACMMADDVGLLRFATIKGHRAWIITDPEGVNAQARRLDGGTWEHISGAKSYTLPGCWAGWPIGARLGSEYPIVALCEGGPDLLAALHFIADWGDLVSVFPVAMLGAKQRIPEDALKIFTGKRVLIIPHEDEQGLAGADEWGRQLESAGAEACCYSLAGLRKADGSAINDLNDCTQIHPDDAAELEGMFDL
jgi:hypothetical protein